ncbi:MAG: redoxin domain-containing protein [Chloroflexi bacterium]|nr:redoxin domain-containing protein [Chloroflexota bacterium]
MIYNPANPFSTNGQLPSLEGATQWFNSAPLTPTDLQGKVVLINFWTYTSINWLRSLPYVRTWAETYREHGLVVIGVHTPEFPFEHDLGNVQRAIRSMKVNYPVAVDNDYAVWNAFNNRYWPGLYLVDAQCHIRYRHFGEGSYVQSERMIQQLLTEAGRIGVSDQLVMVDAKGVEAAADWDNLQSTENYVGYDRSENFASPGGKILDERHTYNAPAQLSLNTWALAGGWTMEHQLARLNQINGRILYRFHARDLHLIMGAPGSGARFRVRIDGQAPGGAHGTDVDEVGNGIVREPRLCQLIRQPQPILDRQFEIEFLDAGVEVYSFTFG